MHQTVHRGHVNSSWLSALHLLFLLEAATHSIRWTARLLILVNCSKWKLPFSLQFSLSGSSNCSVCYPRAPGHSDLFRDQAVTQARPIIVLAEGFSNRLLLRERPLPSPVTKWFLSCQWPVSFPVEKIQWERMELTSREEWKWDRAGHKSWLPESSGPAHTLAPPEACLWEQINPRVCLRWIKLGFCHLRP